MKRFVQRTYTLTSDEVRDAIYGYLHSRDVPVPDSSTCLNFTTVIPAAVEMIYTDEISD